MMNINQSAFVHFSCLLKGFSRIISLTSCSAWKRTKENPHHPCKNKSNKKVECVIIIRKVFHVQIICLHFLSFSCYFPWMLKNLYSYIYAITNKHKKGTIESNILYTFFLLLFPSCCYNSVLSIPFQKKICKNIKGYILMHMFKFLLKYLYITLDCY